jgi:hypothetical protein
MSDVEFFQTRMGHDYYEHTMPELVRQLKRLNDTLDKLSAAVPFAALATLDGQTRDHIAQLVAELAAVKTEHTK